MRNNISGIVSSIFLLLAIYYKFGVNDEGTISDMALYSGSYYFIVLFSALAIFSYLLKYACISSTQIFSAYLFSIFWIANIARELIIVITKDFDLWVNDWKTSFGFSVLCLISNILIICVGRK